MASKFARSTVCALAALMLMMAAPKLLADPSITGNGGLYLDRLSWSSNPSGPVAEVYLGQLSCLETCGVVKMEIEWDDGTVDRLYFSLPAGLNQWFSHQYSDNGLRHVKIRFEDEDEYGNWLNIEPIDISINF